jgi:hypothetical protein
VRGVTRLYTSQASLQVDDVGGNGRITRKETFLSQSFATYPKFDAVALKIIPYYLQGCDAVSSGNIHLCFGRVYCICLQRREDTKIVPVYTLFNSYFPFCQILKGKGFPTQAWIGPEDSSRLRLPEFSDSRYMKVTKLLALRTGRLYPQEIHGTHFC